MIDPYSLATVIASVVNATVQITSAIHTWWQKKRDRQTQYAAYESSRPTANAARELYSLMDVQSEFWRSNPEMWQALGHEAASMLSL
jgi:hypothetical protein